MTLSLKKNLAILFASLFSLLTIGQNFECSSDLYQVVDGNHLKVLIPSTGVYQSVGVSSLTYNGAGFNSEDGYIYGIGSGTTLVKVDNTGEGVNLGTVANFSAISYSGDFDLNGNWYSFKRSGSSWKMNKVDVSVLPPVAEEFSIQELAGAANASSTADMAFNAVTNKFYGMANGLLMEFDPINQTVKTIADYSSISESGGYGAAWSDESGKTYFFNNATGNIYRAAFNETGEILSFAFLSTSAPNGSNDGMGCALAESPIFPEVCDNGLDDDGDGLIDCEDPDCTSSETCGVSGVIFSSTFACKESIATYHTFYTNNSTLSNSITVTEQLPVGFVFLQDTLEFDMNGSSQFIYQPIEGDLGTVKWGPLSLNGGETVRISYDVIVNDAASNGTQENNITIELDMAGTASYPSALTSQVQVGDCPEPAPYTCEPAFYQVYKKKGKNQPNVFGKLDPITGDYDAIAVASDYANGLGFDINTGLVYGASGTRFIQLDENGLVKDQGISFDKKVYRGDINENSEWYGVVGNDVIKIDVNGTPLISSTYLDQGLPGWDLAYNTDGHFYSIHNQNLYQFNTTSNTKSQIGSLSGSSIPENGGYGAQWTGSDGYLYASHNKSGKILRVDVATGEARVVSLSVDGLSKNDGFSCPTQIPVVYEFDYSDNSRLPQSRVLSYRQDLSEDGIPDFSTIWLGNTINYDLTDPSNQDATGDLDDGFTLSTEIDDGALSAVIGFNSNMTCLAYYLIGFDWDDDGNFDTIINEPLDLTTAKTIIRSIDVPTGFEEGAINVRILVSEAGLTNENISGDITAMGEVEDYRYLIVAPCTGPDCEVTTGTNGGLESNGSLAEAIAKRNFLRTKENSTKHLKKFQPAFKLSRSTSRTSGLELADYFPETGLTGNEEVTISSPKDLIAITNATDLFAADYYLSNQRVAASLLLETKGQVYNHSKNVCDRLNGKSIEDVYTTNIDGISVIYAKIKSKSGSIEYSAWFSVKDNGSFNEAFSLWNIDSYPSGDYMNFQAWSSSPGQVFHILKHSIAKLRKGKELKTNSDVQQLPSVLVKRGQYENGSLNLSIINKTGAASVLVEANIRKTEQHSIEHQSYLIQLDGSLEQDITVSTGYLFDAGISLNSAEDNASDALYLADGAWGTDYDPSLSEIATFTVTAVEAEDMNESFLIERGIEVNGKSSDVVNVFRNLKAGEQTLTISEFTTLTLAIQNDHPIEIVLVEEGLVEWDDRLKYTLSTNSSKVNKTIKLTDFSGISLEEELNIKSIVFSYINSSQTRESFSFKVSNLAFGNELILGTAGEAGRSLAIYPNPISDIGTVSFTSDSRANYELRIYDLNGRQVRKTTGETSAGLQTIKVLKGNIEPGIYLILVKLSTDKIMTSKILFR